MALSPNFCATITTNCTKLKVTDITGLYNASTNTGGWGTPNINGSDITEATISYTIGEGDPVEIDVTDVVADTVTGNFILMEEEMEDYEDGFIEITYTITTSSTTYTKTKTIFFTCNARCCVNKGWASVAESCDCESEEKINDLLMAEGLLKAVNSAASCVTSEGRSEILAKIQRLCQWDNCGCND